PGLELEAAQVGHEVGRPLVAPRPDRYQLTLTPVAAVGAHPLGELEVVGEYEILIVEGIEDKRQAGHGGQGRRIPARRVEVLVANVGRQGKEAPRRPLEAVSPAARGDRGAAPPGEHVDDLLVKVTLRRRLAAWRQLDQLAVDEVAPSLEQDERSGST